MDLHGRIALVTGAGRRLGKAIATRVASAGCDVVVHYGRSREAAEETVADLLGMGRRACAIQADLADARQIERLLADAQREFESLDILVNSAATFKTAEFNEISLDEWEAVMAVNLTAPFLLTRHAAPLLAAAAEARQGTSAVINVSDLSGIFPWRGYAHHGASKAGLLQLTRSAALELAPGVRVNAVVPGPILPPPGVSEASEEWFSAGRRVPLGRPGDPQDVGDAVAFLAANEFITGDVLFVDGGEHLHGSSKR